MARTKGNETVELMKQETFGIEIEFSNCAMSTVESALAGAGYISQGWKVVRDGSVSSGGEVVSPILRYDDLGKLADVIRTIKAAGGQATREGSVHIHIGARHWSVAKLQNFCRTWVKYENLMLTAVATLSDRQSRWCKKVEPTFVAALEHGFRSLDEMRLRWYEANGVRPSTEKYNSSRYHALNLHATWTKGTVEIRCFNATLNPDKATAYVHLLLSMAARAGQIKKAQVKQRQVEQASVRYDIRVALLQLGLIGDEFKTTRKTLMSRVNGDCAWKRSAAA